MKNKVNHLSYPISIILVAAIFGMFIFQSHTKINKANPIKDLLYKMHFVKGTKFDIGKVDFDKTTAKDSTLLLPNYPRRVTINSFYISATEVTNSEWWDFYMAKKNELGFEKAVAMYYPDTLVWNTDFPYSYNEPMVRNYFHHPSFKNYPVVGISWTQANDYCEWQTQKLRKLSNKKNADIDITFRLPYQNEWEYAARGIPVDSNNIRLRITDTRRYPWNGPTASRKGNYLANFGRMIDENGVILKGYGDDEALYTSEVGKYPANEFGLYDMAGNVAEWMSDEAGIYDFVTKKMIYKSDEIDLLIESLEANKISDPKNIELYERQIQQITHDRKIISNGDTRFVKGGAWTDGMAYIQIASKEAVDKDKKSSRIGFRMAITYDEKYGDYFPKKYWKPRK